MGIPWEGLLVCAAASVGVVAALCGAAHVATWWERRKGRRKEVG